MNRSLWKQIKVIDKKITQLNSEREEFVGKLTESDKSFFNKYIGRCFKYDNGYNDKERWWVYYKVTGVNYIYLIDKGLTAQVFCESFQEMSDNRHEFCSKHTYYIHSLLDGSYVQIPITEYESEKEKFFKKMMSEAK